MAFWSFYSTQMDDAVASLIELVRENHGIWSLFAVFAAAALEYMVPILPADSVLLASSLLVLAGAYPFFVIFLIAVAGGFCGALTHYYIGRALAREDGGMKGGWLVEKITGGGSIERFFEAYRRHGMWVIALNRAMPGIRGVMFIAAGAARLPVVKTQLAGLVSNIGWTLLLLILGVTVGENWSQLVSIFRIYSTVFYVLGGAALIFYIVQRIRKKRASKIST